MTRPGVELRFPPVPGHVRTARLVASSVARRGSGLDEARLDEVRLAVGEACARAVRRCQAAGIATPVVMQVHDGGLGLLVDVVDSCGGDTGEDPVVLALLKGLADTVEVMPGPAGPGGCIRLGWLPSGAL